MDLSKLSAQVKGFQRRTTQKVLQSVGMADKTEDESQAYQNFLALGSFASQLKTTIQAADTCFEKTCTAQTHLAGQIQSYLSSELSGDGDLPPGELYEFFNSSDATRAHAITLQEVSGKFYAACSELGNNALQAVLGQLDDLVLRPINNDEEFAHVTKDLLEEKRRATLDFDSYRRNPVENEGKLRAAKDRHDQATRRLAEHIDMRNQIRCKLLVHGIVSAMQQYCNFYNHAINIFRDTALSVKPLLELYQMNDAQLQTALNLNEYQTDPRSPPKQHSTTASASSSVFDDYAQQNNHKPKPTVFKTSAAQSTRGPSPQIDDMMRNNMNLGAKPAAQPPKNTPMNQYGTNKASPQPLHQQTASPQPNNRHPSPAPQSVHNSQATRHQSPQPRVTPQAPPTQPHIDLFDNPPTQTQRVQSPVPPPAEILVDLNASSNDLLFGGPSLGGNMAPPIQPANTDPFAVFTAPSFTSPKPVAPQVPQNSASPSPVSDDLLFSSAPPNPTPNRSFPQQSNDPFFAFSGPSTNPPKAADEFETLFGASSTQPRPQTNNTQPPLFSTNTSQNNSQPPVAAGKPKQEERHELNPAVTNRINNWAARGGRQSNLRALLSTLHEVIWVDSGWDALSLADLVSSAQVKKAYIRANLIVHPDKVQNGTTEQQLMAQRIFEALRVSYETFKTEPK